MCRYIWTDRLHLTEAMAIAALAPSQKQFGAN